MFTFVGRARVREPFDEEGRAPAVNEDRLREENERLGDQLRKDPEALERLRLEL